MTYRRAFLMATGICALSVVLNWVLGAVLYLR